MAQLDSNIVLKAYATPQLDIVGTMRDAQDRKRQMMLQQRQESDYARQQQAEQTSLANRSRAAQLAAQGQYDQADQEAGLGVGDFDVHKSIAALRDEHRAQVKQKFASAAPVAIQALQEQDPARRQAMIQAAGPSLVENGWKPEEIAAFQPTDANLQRLINDARTVDSALAQYDASRKPMLVGEGQQMRLPDGTLVAEGAPKFHAVTTPAGGTTTVFGAPGQGGVASVEAMLPAIVQQESQGNYAARNPTTGAMGAYQVMPATAKTLAGRLGLPWRPELMTAASGDGRQYQDAIGRAAVSEAVEASGGDPATAAAYYHGGSDRGKWGPKTRQYAQEVTAKLGGGGPMTIKGQPKAGGNIPGGPDGEGAKTLAGKGYRYKPDGTLEPIPGGPAELGDTEMPPPKEIAKRNASYPKVAGSYRNATFEIDAQIRDLEKLKADSGLDNIVGAIDGRLPAVLPNSARAKALLNKILARGQFRALQDMRANSPTGGALGAVSDSENKTLRQSVAALNQTQDEATFRGVIDDYISDLKASRSNLTQTFEDTYAYRKAGRSSAPASGGGKPTVSNW